VDVDVYILRYLDDFLLSCVINDDHDDSYIASTSSICLVLESYRSKAKLTCSVTEKESERRTKRIDSHTHEPQIRS
jgi:hypothetical protein